MVTLYTVGLLVLPVLVGHLFYRAFAPSEEEDGSLGEILFVQVFAGILLCGWLALLLAEVGLFTLPCLASLLLFGSGIMIAVRRPQVRCWHWPRPHANKMMLLTLTLFLGIGIFLFRPGEWVLGGQDPGVYVATGASIARTGSIVLRDPWIAAMPAQARRLLFRFYIGQWWQLPGFYITDFATGEVVPQFLHLYPTWLALFHAAGGISLSLAATPLLTLLGLVAFFLLARRIFGEWTALVALVLLALNPAQLWYARQPVSESLTLLLLFGGWHLFDRAMRQPARRDLAVLAGLALGQVALAKIEFLILSLLLYGYFFLRFVVDRLQPNQKVFLLVYTLLMAHAAGHVTLIARPYLQTVLTALEHSRLLSRSSERGPFLSHSAVLLLSVLILLGIAFLWILRKRIARFLHGRSVHQGVLRIVLAALWLLLVLFGVVLWPTLSPARIEIDGQWYTNYDRLSFLRLRWYLSPLGLGLAILGVWWWLRHRVDGPSLPFLVTFLAQLAIYAYRTMAYPYHFWTVRRYIPLVFPCLTMGIAVALWRMRLAPWSQVVRRGSTMLLVGLLVLQAVQADFPLSSRRELAGTLQALAGLAARVPDHTPLLIEHSGAALATPLRYLYGKEAFELRQPTPWETLWRILQEWPADVDEAYILLEGPPVVLRGGISLIEVGALNLETWMTERGYDHLPREAVLFRSIQRLYRMQRRPAVPTSLEVSFLTPVWTPDCVTVKMPAPAAPLHLRLRVSGFRPETVPSPRLWVLWQGTRVRETVLDPSGQYQEVQMRLLSPPGHQVTTGEIQLQICSDTWTPRAVGHNDDPRNLGVLLKALSLEEDR